ncbi:MAG: polymerase sigma-70 factor, subfamily [Chloroflexia bacterium]|jgi:RNA polymerase sigma-70 factor (ECF subfamily)|nr:polymerase sigma-70 factor, subfamily [Chloroflexia bacterium]
MVSTEAYNEHRPLLFSLAYRMLGSVADAEDIVQEAFLRWHKATETSDEQAIRSPRSYLSTIVTRLCIDQLRSARVRREVYVGPWLPEPLVEPGHADPTEELELADSLSVAFMVLLESLSPEERAVFLLRQVFDYDYGEIARIVNKSEANCRQMVHRAQQHIAERRPRFSATPEQREQLTHTFIQTCANGDMQGLLSLLTQDIVLYSDGGGKVQAARNPIYGPDKVARFILGALGKLPPGARYRVKTATVNGQMGVVAYLNDEPNTVLSLDIAEGRIQGVYLVVNPDKLQHIPEIE